MHLKFLSFLGICALLLSLLTGCTAYMAGNSNLGKENYEAAISNYIEVLSKNPKHWQARQRLGFAYLKTGQFDQAVRELETSLVEKPGEPFATFYLGLTWLNKGENLRAIKAWRTYKNEENPLVEEEINRQLMVLEMVESLRFAKQALAEEEKLQRTPPQSGTVSVFYFKDITPDNRFRPVQKALATMIITDLAQIESLQVMERLRVQCLLTEMQMGQCGIVDEQSAPRAGRLLGAENLIVGTLEPGSMAVKTSVTSTSKKDVVGGFSVTNCSGGGVLQAPEGSGFQYYPDIEGFHDGGRGEAGRQIPYEKLQGGCVFWPRSGRSGHQRLGKGQELIQDGL
jgi:hypothetical protein